MIYHKAKLQGTVLEEFRKYVWPIRSDRPITDAPKFVDDILIPYAEAFFTMKNEDYQSSKLAEKVKHLFKWLNRIDNSDWIPPAMLYFSRNHDHPEEMVHFFSDLERLAVSLMILRANVNKRMERYTRPLTVIENKDDLYTANSPLQLTIDEQKEILTSLNDNLYYVWFCKHVLLRLDEALADVDASYNYALTRVKQSCRVG